jgi:hypothetical protein
MNSEADMIAATALTAIPNRQFLEELMIRLDTLCRYMSIQGDTDGYLDEGVSIAGAMVQRAGALRDSLRAAKGQTQTVSLAELGALMDGFGLVPILRSYDRLMSELQNEVGDEVRNREIEMQAPDVPGRDVLDKLEAEHFQLHRIIREVVAL